MTTKYHSNSDVFNRSVWFDPKNNKVFGYQDSGEPNKSFVPAGCMDGFKQQMSVIQEQENIDESGDVALEVQNGFDANKFDAVIDIEESKYFSGYQPTIKQKKPTNPLDELILKGNGDVAHSYLAPEKNPKMPGFTRGGYQGYFRTDRERAGEILH